MHVFKDISNKFRFSNICFKFILVPPRIEDSMSSGDKVRTEGSNVTLECAAHGSPKPTVNWKREDRLDITIDRSKNITGTLIARID